MPPAPPEFTLAAVAETDFEELAALRTAAMRESLEQLGRFDPERSRTRLRNSFSPADTSFILRDGQRIGFIATRRDETGLHLDHLYIAPAFQRIGVGGAVLNALCHRADASGLTVFVTALRDSGANAFYQRHGFGCLSQSEWDNHYARPPDTFRTSDSPT